MTNPIPPIGREAIYAAVFAFWQGLTVAAAPAFKTATRKVTAWDAVPPEDTPALLQQQRRELAQARKGLPIRWTLEIELFVYVHTGALNDPTVVPSQVLNPLLDAIEGALAVDDPINNACTLGGLVSSCSINGPIEIFQGDLGDQEIARIPISIVTPH